MNILTEKIYYGVCDYEGEPAVLLANANSWDRDRVEMCHPISKEVYAIMADMHLEYIEETLWGYFDGTEEELNKVMKEAGFTFNQDVKEEADSILGD